MLLLYAEVHQNIINEREIVKKAEVAEVHQNVDVYLLINTERVNKVPIRSYFMKRLIH